MNVVERLQHIQQWEELKQVPSPIVRARRGMHPANSARRNPNNSEENKQASTDERAAESDSSDPPDKEARGPAIIGMICFACDAGMGSSAMGAAMLKKKMKAAGIGGDVKVVHSALDQIPQEADLIITHQYLLRRAMASLPDREYLTIDSYTSSPIYETLLERLRRQSAERITHDQVFMACEAASRKDAARQAAARLALLGYADESALDRLMGGEGAIIAEPCPGVAFALLTATGGRTGKMRNGTVLLQFPEGVPGEKGPIGLMIGMTCSEETFDSRSLTLAVLRLSEGDIHALRKTRSKQEMIEAFRRANEAMTSDGDKGIR
jgi:Phosphotransferase system, mannitol-specific IIBC component